MYNLNNLKYLPYLIFLVIPSYIIGIAVTETLLFLLLLIFFFTIKDFSYFSDPKVLFLISFSLLACLSGLLNLHHTDLKIASTFHFRYVLISIAIAFFLNKFFKEKNYFSIKFFYIFFLIIFFIIVDSIIQYFLGYNLFGHEIVNYRISGIFGDELILGSFLFQLLPLNFLLILFFKFNETKNYNYLIAYFSLYLISIYVASARAPFFLSILLIILVIYFVKNFRNILIKSLLVLLIFIACEVFFKFGKISAFHRVFVITFIQFTNHYYNPVEEVSEIINNNDNVENKIRDTHKLESKKILKNFFKNLKIFSDDHQNHYILAFKLFKEKPIIGVGPKGFRSYCRSVKYDPPVGICTTHPHNYFIQILSELGLVGIFFYLIGIFFIIIKLINSFLHHKKNILSSEFYVISLGLIVLLFPITSSGNFFNNWLSIINYYYIGFYLFFFNQYYD